MSAIAGSKLLAMAWCSPRTKHSICSSNSSAQYSTATKTILHTGKCHAHVSIKECMNGYIYSSHMKADQMNRHWKHHRQHQLSCPWSLWRPFIGRASSLLTLCDLFRDLKLDNTLLDGNDPPVLKICDFGFARQFNNPLERTNSHLGCDPSMPG